MALAAKVSVSIDSSELEWARHRAESKGVSLSAVVTEAVRLAHQHEARLRVVNWLGPAATLTPKRQAEILAEWQRNSKSKRPRASHRRHGR